LKEVAVTSCRKKEERGALLGRGYSPVFGLLSWLFSGLASWWFVSHRERVILELYLVIESILKKFCWVFFPLRVSPG
jgi:hypothetical protein